MKKKGKSEKKTDWLGRTYVQHYRSDGSKSGRSEFKKDFWGKQYTQHYNDGGSKTGSSERKESFTGREYTQKYDSSGRKSGTSEKKTRLFGSDYTQHYDSKGNKADISEHKTTLLGGKYTERYGNDDPLQRSQNVGFSGSDENPRSFVPARVTKPAPRWAVAVGYIVAFLGMGVAAGEGNLATTKMGIIFDGNVSAIIVFWAFTVGILSGVTVTALLSGRLWKTVITGGITTGLIYAFFQAAQYGLIHN